MWYCDAKHSGILPVPSHVRWCLLFLGCCGQKWVQSFRSQNSCQEWIDEMIWFFAWWYKLLGGYTQKWGDLLDQGTIKLGVSHKSFHESRRLIEWFLHADSDWIIFGLMTNLLCIFKKIPPQVLLGKGVLKYAATLQKNSHDKVWFQNIEITLQHGCSPVNLLHIFRTHFPKNTSQGLLLYYLHLLGAVALVKNVLLLVPRGKVLGLDFPNAFNKSLIKCGKIV